MSRLRIDIFIYTAETENSNEKSMQYISDVRAQTHFCYLIGEIVKSGLER
jgi:hypothetical protein